jgi:hypothetical protein
MRCLNVGSGSCSSRPTCATSRPCRVSRSSVAGSALRRATRVRPRPGMMTKDLVLLTARRIAIEDVDLLCRRRGRVDAVARDGSRTRSRRTAAQARDRARPPPGGGGAVPMGPRSGPAANSRPAAGLVRDSGSKAQPTHQRRERRDKRSSISFADCGPCRADLASTPGRPARTHLSRSDVVHDRPCVGGRGMTSIRTGGFAGASTMAAVARPEDRRCLSEGQSMRLTRRGCRRRLTERAQSPNGTPP